MNKPEIVREFTGPNLLQIAMPMGGIGAGCICLNGHGGLQDFSIRHKPDTTALPDGHFHRLAAFALLHIKGRQPVTRLVEGPMNVERIYDQGLQAQGYRKGGHEGLPRFSRVKFRGNYPFGEVTLADDQVPLLVSVTGWSPFVPNDALASGIPAAILEYTLYNPTRKTVECELSYHLSHLATGKSGEQSTRSRTLPGKGVFFFNVEPTHEATFGSATLSVIGHTPAIKAMWLRGQAWTYESLTALWREVSEGRFQENTGNEDKGFDGRDGGSVLVKLKLQAGEQVTVPFVINWHFPNVYDSPGSLTKPEAQPCNCAGGCEPKPAWQPWYVTQWKDAAEVAGFVHEQYQSLRQRTVAFTDALYGSTLPEVILDAIGSNLAILKSPTVLRQSSGNVWGWEGCFCEGGCCSGSCTHVWNYAQALPHLFPALERTLREQELERSMDERGHVSFRSALPDGPTGHGWHAAADGQLGGILKLYRDWQISGDSQWLAKMYPMAKRSLDFCISHWDPQRKGAVLEPHHNTYDIEFWGADGMCTSIYCAALAAMSQMAEAMKEKVDAKSYRQLAERSAKYLQKNLFNGQFFDQKVEWKKLQATPQFNTMLSDLKTTGHGLAQIVEAEGPRYQYAGGCLSDGVIGAWMARMYGVETPQDAVSIRKHLKSIYRHNFRADLFEHACLQRPGYAIGHEGGLILCTWPNGGKPTLPFIYSDEVWTGIEYQVASHLIAEGMVDEGLQIVSAARARYDGHARNPFNEYECGNYYARAMASYALLQAYSGFRYSAVEETLWMDPKTARRPFRTFFSTASGHGVIELTKKSIRVQMLEGTLKVKKVILGVKTIPCDVEAGSNNDASIKI